MKKLSFDIMSDLTCSGCGRPLKQNLVNKKDNPQECYKCHIEAQADRGHMMMGKQGLTPAPTFKRIKL